MGRGSRQKRKADVFEDDIDISLSDVEDRRTVVRVDYTIDKISDDHRRVHRESHSTQVRSEVPRSSVLSTAPSAMQYFHDLSAIDVEGIRSEGKKYRKDNGSRKKRYISSVRATNQDK